MLQQLFFPALCLVLAIHSFVRSNPVRGGPLVKDAVNIDDDACFQSLTTKILNKTLLLGLARMTEATLYSQLSEIPGNSQGFDEDPVSSFCSSRQEAQPSNLHAKRERRSTSSFSFPPTVLGEASTPTGQQHMVLKKLCNPPEELVNNFQQRKPEKKLRFIAGIEVELKGLYSDTNVQSGSLSRDLPSSRTASDSWSLSQAVPITHSPWSSSTLSDTSSYASSSTSDHAARSTSPLTRTRRSPEDSSYSIATADYSFSFPLSETHFDESTDFDISNLDDCSDYFVTVPMYYTEETDYSGFPPHLPIYKAVSSQQTTAETSPTAQTSIITSTKGMLEQQLVSPTAAQATARTSGPLTTGSSVEPTSTAPSTTSVRSSSTLTAKASSTTRIPTAGTTTQSLSTSTNRRSLTSTLRSGERPKPRSFQEMSHNEIWKDWFGVFDGFLRSKRQAADHKARTQNIIEYLRGENNDQMYEAVCLLLDIGRLDGDPAGTVSVIYNAVRMQLMGIHRLMEENCQPIPAELESTSISILSTVACVLDYLNQHCIQ